jgi:NAD(P)-dependent dehydrogenase (short-subunit alcohol dehydrogenase family)
LCRIRDRCGVPPDPGDGGPFRAEDGILTGELHGRVALVTGSASGIGREIAEALGRGGAALVAHGIDPMQNEATLADWRASGWNAIASATDLSEPDAAARLYGEVRAALGPPDILILNASIELPETLPALTPEAMAAQVAVNLSASCLLLQACLPTMAERGWGRIIAIGSVQEERPNARHLFYAGTKAALTSIVLNLARNERAPRVTFNVIRPGAILTDRNRAILSDPAFENAVLERIPSGRIGQPSDCAGIVSLLCSQAGSYINGAVISVDGGMRL